jgi:hypothetical protein
MSKYEDMEEDALSELVEESEGNANVKTLVGICTSGCSRKDFETVMEEGLDALLRLSSGLDMEKLNALKQASVCDMIPLALTKYQEEASIIEVLFGLIRNLSKPVEGSKEDMRSSLGQNAGAMIDCMNEHAEGEATLQEMACLAIEALCTGHEANIEQFKSVEAPNCLNEISRPAITNERNKTYPDKALTAMNL